MKMKHKLLLLLIMFFGIVGQAQNATMEPQMSDGFRSEGKIYVVITVISIIFVCLMGYLISIDRKLKKLEDKKNN